MNSCLSLAILRKVKLELRMKAGGNALKSADLSAQEAEMCLGGRS